VARRVAAALGAPLIGLDAYYRDLAHLPLEKRALANFDVPEALDEELLFTHMRRLAGGAAAEIPGYDFTRPIRSAPGARVEPSDFVVVEGLFTLYWEELRCLLAVKVFVAADHEVCLARRIERDVRERGRTRESVLKQYADTVRPMADQHVLPTRRFAGLVLDGTAAVETSVARVLQAVARVSPAAAVR
jgi:uridine kinase